MRSAEKRQEVVLAEAKELDVLDDDHLVVDHAERRAVEHVVDVLVIATGEELKRFFETLRRFAQPFAIGIFANDFDQLAHVTSDAIQVGRFAVVSIGQQDFFGRLTHEWFSSLFPANSKLLLAVSWMRTRSSLAWGKHCKRLKISMHRFSVVGTLSRNTATSSLSER